MRSDVHSSRNLVILHNSPAPDPRHEKVAADIVRLTLGNGLDDKYLKPHVKAAMATVLTTFSGDWTGHAVTHRCCVPLCPGGKTCRQKDHWQLDGDLGESYVQPQGADSSREPMVAMRTDHEADIARSLAPQLVAFCSPNRGQPPSLLGHKTCAGCRTV